MFSLMDTMEVRQSFPEPSPLLREDNVLFLSSFLQETIFFLQLVTFVFHLLNILILPLIYLISIPFMINFLFLLLRS